MIPDHCVHPLTNPSICANLVKRCPVLVALHKHIKCYVCMRFSLAVDGTFCINHWSILMSISFFNE